MDEVPAGGRVIPTSPGGGSGDSGTGQPPAPGGLSPEPGAGPAPEASQQPAQKRDALSEPAATAEEDAGQIGSERPEQDAGPESGAGRERSARAGRGTRRAPRRPRQRPGLLVAGLVVITVTLAVAAGLLVVSVRDSSAAASRRTAVLAAARQEAVSLTTVNRQTGNRDFRAVLAGAAGSLKQQLAQGRAAFLKTLSSARVSSAGTVLDAGIVTMNDHTATVLLNVRATLRNKQTVAPERRNYHWRAGLVYSGGRWLVTSLEFV